MNLPTFRAISSVGQIGSIEGSEVTVLSVNKDRGFKPRPVRVNPFWKVVLTAFLLWSVLGILTVSGESKILPFIVERVSISVIDSKSFRYLDSHQGENNVVYIEPDFSVCESKGHHIIATGSIFSVRRGTSGIPGIMIIVPLPFEFPLEVGSWALLPCKDSSFRIVGKRFAEKFTECYLVNRPEFSLHTFNEFGFRAGGIDVPSGSTFLTARTSRCKCFLTG